VSTIDPPTAAPLIGTRCDACSRTFFPPRDLCPSCWAEGLPAQHLPLAGTVATWTVVRLGKRFETPYALCYADFEGDVRVLGRVVNWAEERPLHPGMTVTTHAVTERDESGRMVTAAYTFTADYSPRET
jgi:uncharacterized OB-fold protein